jgi:hypothetical protein
MPRWIAMVLLLAHTVTPDRAHCQAPLPLLLPGPTDIVALIDALTKKDSDTSVDVKLKRTFGQGKLLVARARVDVAMERSSRNWRGRVLVRMSVPSEISYAIDLSDIRPDHVRVEADGRRLVIAMPAPKVEDVTPMLDAVRADNTFKAARFRLFDSATSQSLQNAMLTHDYLIRAREVGAQQAAKVREQGRAALQEFLRKLLEGPCPGVEVVVE